MGILAADRGGVDASTARAIATLALALGVVLRRRPRACAACAVGALAAAGAASLALRLEAAAAARPAAPFEATIEATVARVERRPERLVVDLAGAAAVAEAPARVPSRIRVRAPLDRAAPHPPLVSALPGDRLRLRVRLRALDTRANPGRPDAEEDFARRGFGAVAGVVHPDLVVRLPQREGVRPLRGVHAVRARADARLQREGRGGALLAALALGERGGLDAATNDAFRQLGLTHLLSVSGLHLLLASVLAYRLALPVAARIPASTDARRASLAAALAVAAGYALLAGFEVPVRRSLVMLLALAISFGARRPVRRAAPIALALLVIVLAEPVALFDAGAQMSFLATAALVLARRPTSVSDGSAFRRLADSLDTSALATAATAPVAAAAIGVLSPWGIAANLVAVPWTGVVLLPLALAAAAIAAVAPEHLLAGHALHGAAALAEHSVAAGVWIASHLPAAFEARPPAWAIAAALLGAFAVLRLRGRLARLAVTVGLLALLVLAPPDRVGPPPPRLVALDVGQGDATLVQGRRASVLVDAGTALPGGPDLGASVVVPALRALGVRRLDLAVATHADLDHRGGLVSVLARLPVERLWLPAGGREDAAFGALLAVARTRGVAVEERGAGDPPRAIGDLTVETPWPPRGPGRALSRNDASLVLRIAVAGRRVLLPGDIEAAAEAALVASGAALGADVVKLAHHGSRTSSTRAFLAAAGGEVAVASAPRFGRFGMPHRDVEERARALGYALWWTGRDGAVLVGLDPVLTVWGWRRR